MNGSVIRWFYQALAGIYPDEDNPGFKNVIINPSICSELTFTSADYNSIYGKISSSWKLSEGDFQLDIEIPANTTATVFIPGPNPEEITEGGEAPTEVYGIEFIRFENNRSVYKIGSGDYKFISKDIASLL